MLAFRETEGGWRLSSPAGRSRPSVTRSAAVLWGLLNATGEADVSVSVARQTGRARQRGIRLHRCRTLPASAVTRRNNIPVTTPARTIADLRGAVSGRELRRATRQAEVLGLRLGESVERDGTRSDLERDFLHICRRYRLPAPEVNVRVGPYLVDFLWRDRRLVVETDGYRYHRGRQAFRDDHARDLELRAQGFEAIRLSEEQVGEEPEKVAAILGEMLASRPHRVGPDGQQETR
jgi:very-short-patch-repair endonuclease